MRENLARQQAAYKRQHGAPMPAALQAHALATMLALQSLYFEDAPSESEARPELLLASFWAALVPGASLDPEALRAALAAAAAQRSAAAPHPAPHPALAASVREQGFFIAEPQPGSPAALRTAAQCAALVLIQAALRAAALPPHFCFVYNAPWELLAEHWATTAAAALGEGSYMEADMSCWALRREEEGGPGAPYIGANFGSSHRDQRYSACHDAASGQATSVNLWTPFNASGAAADNGAMRVLPIEADAFFFSPEHPLHLDTGASLAEEGAAAAVRVLACSAGAAAVWTPALIHYGGGCAAHSLAEPRASLAVTFRAAGAPRSSFGGGSSGGGGGGGGGGGCAGGMGPPPMLMAQLSVLPLQRRLAYVAKGLLAYSHWHPGFPGLVLAK